jgi:hypothetical protein
LLFPKDIPLDWPPPYISRSQCGFLGLRAHRYCNGVFDCQDLSSTQMKFFQLFERARPIFSQKAT